MSDLTRSSFISWGRKYCILLRECIPAILYCKFAPPLRSGINMDEITKTVLEGGSDEEFVIQQQALERPAPISGEDLSVPPKDGVEYLRRVIKETKGCKSVVVVEAKKKPQQKLKRLPLIPEPATCDKALLPDKAWQLSAIADFSDLRLSLEALRKKLTDASVHNLLSRLPTEDDDEGWLQVVLQPNDDLSATSLPTPGPSTKLCLALRQTQLYELLSLMVVWLEDGDIGTVGACRWVYCLLACLNPPFSSSVYSSLRQIARELINRRAKLVSLEAEDLPNINLLVCIIGRYFNQVDLADPFT